MYRPTAGRTSIAGQFTGSGKGAAAAHGDRQAERRHEGLLRAAAPLVERTLLLVRAKPVCRQGFREPCRTLATFVTLASIQLALRRLARA
jgi:hypothetical protein